MIQPHQFWQTSRSYLELLRENDIAVLIHADESTKFLAEVAWLNYWNAALDDGPRQEGLDSIAHEIDDDHLVIDFIYQPINVSEKDAEIVTITYDLNADSHTEGYPLQIIHNDQLIYLRSQGQNEASEWEINAMAGDPEVVDEHGNMIFSGDHTNI